MLIQTLFQSAIERWPAFLLSAIPLVLNICLLIYFRLRIPDTKTARLFSLFQLALIAWQFSDTMVRLSVTREQAQYFSSLFSFGPIFTTALGFHFSLLLTGKKKLGDSFTVMILNYAPSIIFFSLILINEKEFNFLPSAFWGWVFTTGQTSLWAIQGYWMSLQAMLTLFILVQRTISLPKKHPVRKQVALIATGFSIPVVLGVASEVVLPAIDNQTSIPLTTTFLTCFSCATFLAITKYRLFNINESLKIPTIMNALTDILVVMDIDGTIRYINRQGSDILGTRRWLLIDKQFSSLLAGREAEWERVYKDLVIPSIHGEKVMNFSTELVVPNGKTLTVLVSAISFSEGVHHHQMLLLLQDITLLVRTTQQLAKRENELEEKNSELRTFFYRATHDLKGPSASIAGLVRLARMENFPPAVMQYLDKIETSATTLEGILLEFIRVIHIQEREIKPVPVHFESIVNEILDPIRDTGKAFGMEFRTEINCETEFYSDTGLINSIMYNLLTNAVNYRKKQPDEASFVSVAIHRTMAGVNITVSDNGIGIPAELQPKIFTIFFRGSENSKGSGLGLYIVKNAVNKLGGRIDLSSSAGKGTSFHIFLPNAKASPAEEMPVQLSA